MNDSDFNETVDNLEEFPRDDDSTIFVKDRQKKGKLAGLVKHRNGKITGETEHTITFFSKNKKAEKIFSKRDVTFERIPKEKANKKQEKPKRAKQYAFKEIEKIQREETAQNSPNLNRTKWKTRKAVRKDGQK